MRALVDRQAEQLVALARRESDPLADVQRHITLSMGPDAPRLEGIARRLKTSSRQLQRRLTERGTTFSELVDKSRLSVASELLRARDLSIAEIAYLLGYSEPSAFTRAFKRWTGISPSSYRRGDSD